MNIQDISTVKKYALAYMLAGKKDYDYKIKNFEKAKKMIEPYMDVLKNPVLPIDVKKIILNKILPEELIRTCVYDFILLLVENRRIGFIEYIDEEINKIYLASKNTVKIDMYVKDGITESEKDNIIKILKDSTGKNIILSVKQDKNIIGGFILRYDDIMFDATLNTKLNKLKKLIFKE